MKDYDKYKESSHLQYQDLNYLYGWTVLQNLPLNNFQWIKDTSQFNEDFIKIIMKRVMKDIFLKLMLKLHNGLPFLPGSMKIKKVEKLAANFHDKNEYAFQIINSKQALNHGLVLKRLHKVIK